MHENITEAINALTHELHEYREDRKREHWCSGSTSNLTTKQDLTEMEGRIMSAISDFADKVNANFTQIQAGIAALDAQIQAFQNSPGTLSATDQAALDAIVASSTQLATNAQAPVVPAVPV